MRRREFLATATAALAAPHIARAEAARPLRFIPQADLGDARSALDHRLRHAQPQLSRVRHAVRQQRRVPAVAADGRGPRDRGRRQALDTHVARRAAVARRRESACARLRRQHPPLGDAGRVRAGADGGDRRTCCRRRQTHRVPAEAPVSAAAERARQERVADGGDDAGAAGEHRCDDTAHRDRRQRAVPLPRRRARARRPRRLREVRPLRAARGRHARNGRPGRSG